MTPDKRRAGVSLDRGQWGLIALLATIVMFEGFDVSTTAVVLPYVGREFHASLAALGEALAIIALGSIAAWPLLRLADRFGRRPMLLIAASGFSLGSLATVLSHGLVAYTAIQFVTRAMLVSQIALAYVIVSETLPPERRGGTNGLLGAIGSFGAALPFFAIGKALATPVGWRLLFVLGALPLVMMPILLWRLAETPLWLASRGNQRARSSSLAELKLLWAPALRARFVAMSLLWFIINFSSATGTLFFTQYVARERGWPASDLARIAPFSLAAAFVGAFLAGSLSDRIGRRPTLILFMAALGAMTMLCYSSTGWLPTAASFVGIQMMLGVWIVAYTINSELFPTALRGAANGWCNNLLGRWGVVIAPATVGLLGTHLDSVARATVLLGGVAWLALPVTLLLLPETRGVRLDD